MARKSMSAGDLIKSDLPENMEDINVLCRNSIDLIRYARGLVVQQINIIETMT